MDIAGRAAIVTGGGSGLGMATATALAAAGAQVALLDRDGAAAERAAAAIGGLGIACDVTDANAAVAALAQAAARHGPPRLLVNCAGIAPGARIVGRDGPMKLADFEHAIRVNLIGSFNMLRLAAAAMAVLEPLAGGERGLIVNTASVAAYEGQIGQAAYAAAKAGIVGMTLPAARELAQHGIRVLTIAPGLFRTPMVAGLPEATQASLGAAIPFPPRLGLPEEYAALVLHACANQFLNGETIRLDGALRMAPK